MSLKLSHAHINCSFEIYLLFCSCKEERLQGSLKKQKWDMDFKWLTPTLPSSFQLSFWSPFLCSSSASHCGFSQLLLVSSPFTASLLHPLPLAYYIPEHSLAGRVFNMLLLIHSADYCNTAQPRKRGGLCRDFRPFLLVTLILHIL